MRGLENGALQTPTPPPPTTFLVIEEMSFVEKPKQPSSILSFWEGKKKREGQNFWRMEGL